MSIIYGNQSRLSIYAKFSGYFFLSGPTEFLCEEHVQAYLPLQPAFATDIKNLTPCIACKHGFKRLLGYDKTKSLLRTGSSGVYICKVCGEITKSVHQECWRLSSTRGY